MNKKKLIILLDYYQVHDDKITDIFNHLLLKTYNLLLIVEKTMKTILVTGGAGYIGSITVRELVKEGHDVVVLDNLEAGHKEAIDSKVKLEVVDLKNKDELAKVFSKYKFDAVIDFAAHLDVGKSMSKPKSYMQNNVVNFINLLDSMVEAGCKYIIKSSTAAVYGNPLDEKKDVPLREEYLTEYKPKESALLEGVWDNKEVKGEEFFQKFIGYFENHFIDRPDLKLTNTEKTMLRIPLSIYGLSKLLDEIILKKYDDISGIKSVALRYFNVCGAHPSGDMGEDKPNPSTLMIIVIQQLLGKRDEVKIFGDDFKTPDGTGVRDYIHPSDLATGHITALLNLIKTNESDTFNLGTSNGSSVYEVIKACEKASGKKVKYSVEGRRSGDPSISIAKVDKAKKILGWKAKFNLGDMAKTDWEWHVGHPNGYETTKEPES